MGMADYTAPRDSASIIFVILDGSVSQLLLHCRRRCRLEVETRMDSKMAKTVAVAKVVPQSAEALWRLIRSGGDVHRLLPSMIETCRVEGSGPGARRVCGTKQGPIEETILCVEDDARLFRYRIDRQSMMPLEHYEASLHVTDLGGGRAEVLWFATYHLLDEQADAPVREGLLGMFQAAIDGMDALLASA
jgi:hypothetical protein